MDNQRELQSNVSCVFQLVDATDQMGCHSGLHGLLLIFDAVRMKFLVLVKATAQRRFLAE